jgi:hypothetical protein
MEDEPRQPDEEHPADAEKPPPFRPDVRLVTFRERGSSPRAERRILDAIERSALPKDLSSTHTPDRPNDLHCTPSGAQLEGSR